MKRVMIVGGPGSGKSTLARKLGDVTGLPVHHIDHIHWQPGWVERSAEEKDRLCREVHQLERWIFEGGHSRTHPERLERADTYVWLDVPVGLRIWRVLKRSCVYYGRNRPDLPKGCPERFNGQTIEFLRFILRTRKTARKKLRAMYDNPPDGVEVFRLTSLKDGNRFIQNVETSRK